MTNVWLWLQSGTCKSEGIFNSLFCFREILPGQGRGSWLVWWRMEWTLPTATIWTALGMLTDKQSLVWKSRQIYAVSICMFTPWLTLLNPLPVPADLMMGLPVTEDLYSIFSKEKEHEEKESQRGAQEQVSLLLQTYMQLLLPDDEKLHGGWALINCDMRLVASCPV